MKRFFTILLLLILLAMLALPTLAEDTVYTHGTLRYTVADQSVTIVGAFGSSRELTVPPSIGGTPVNTIASGAFAGCTALETLNLPDTITDIGDGAIPDGVQVVYNSNTDPSLVPPALLRTSQQQTPTPDPTADPDSVPGPTSTPADAPVTPVTPTSGDAVSEVETDISALEQSETPAVSAGSGTAGSAAPLAGTAAPGAAPPAEDAAPDAAPPAEDAAPGPGQLAISQSTEAEEESPAAAPAANRGVWYLAAAALVLTAALILIVLRLHRR